MSMKQRKSAETDIASALHSDLTGAKKRFLRVVLNLEKKIFVSG